MNETNNLEPTDRPAMHPPRLRVDTSGLSEATRRELGLAGFEAAKQMRPTGREGGIAVRPHTADGPALRERFQTIKAEAVHKATPGLPEAEVGGTLPARAFAEEERRAGSSARREPGSNPNGLEHHLSPAEKAEGGIRNKKTPGRDEPQLARHQPVEKQIFGGEDGQPAQGVKPANGAAISGLDQERIDPHENLESDSLGEGYNQGLADGLAVPRPGRGRSGERATRPEKAPAPARDRSPTGPGLPAPERREESERLQELQAAVNQNIAHNHQTHTAMLQTLRGSVQWQRAQQAELERLAGQVRTLLAQQTNAGFNRQ